MPAKKATTTKTSSYDKFRREELAKIHIGRKDLGLSEEIYRDILWQAGKANSSADLDYKGRVAVLERYKELGWKPKHAKKGAAKPTRSTKPSRPLADDPQSKKIRSLWLQLHQAGKVKNPAESALVTYVKRMTRVDALEWLTVEQASTVIEALKKWLGR